MRRSTWAVLGLLAVALAAFAVLAGDGRSGSPSAAEGRDMGPGPGLSSWHIQESLGEGGLKCAVCHYSPGPVWTMEWSAGPDGGWDLAIKPTEPDVPLVAVAAGAYEPVLVQLDGVKGSLDAEGRWRLPFVVPANASSLVVEYRTERTVTHVDLAAGFAVEQTSDGAKDVPSEVWAVAPDGMRHAIMGPEGDLHMALFGRDVVRTGTWALEVDVDDPEPSRYTPVASVEVLAGEVEPATAATPATFHFDGEVPPAVVEAYVRPYHDHAPYEDQEWDADDTHGYRVGVATLAGPAPPPAWALADPLAAWTDREAVVVLDREVEFFEVYEDRPGHKDDGDFFNSKPKYYTPADPVPAGTTSVVLDATWLPPTDEPLLDMRVKPHGTLRYGDAAVLFREPGHARFEWITEPWMWDVADHASGDHATHGSWDFAPYFQPSGQDVERHAAHLRLQAIAVPG